MIFMSVLILLFLINCIDIFLIMHAAANCFAVPILCHLQISLNFVTTYLDDLDIGKYEI